MTRSEIANRLGLTDQQMTNLKTLADGLMALPDEYTHFDMSVYCCTPFKEGEQELMWSSDSDRARKARAERNERQMPIAVSKNGLNHCGTAACAAGHGPVMGIKPKSHEHWIDYISRCFTNEDDTDVGYNEVYDWCFGEGWGELDNTPKGAAQRIHYMLEHGIPAGFYAGVLEDGEADEYVELYRSKHG